MNRRYKYWSLSRHDPDDPNDVSADDSNDSSDEIVEDRLGMRVSSGIVKLRKDDNGRIGISIGGGAPWCSCLYIIQVFDKSVAQIQGTLEAGDEIVAVNGISLKGRTKIEAAKMIQNILGEVVIKYNKIHVDTRKGKTFDIWLKKMKHRFVEHLSSRTADSLGLSRAILCNDSLLQKLEHLRKMEGMYRGLVTHGERLIQAHIDICYIYKAFGDVFAEIAVRETNTEVSKKFTKFAEIHRNIELKSYNMVRNIKSIIGNLKTFLTKAIPDTKLTIEKYADIKFEYLSYHLKIKELDDEEFTCQNLSESLRRVETGNYRYRMILRYRQESRIRFTKMRSDVQTKIDLLDQKHAKDITQQISTLIAWFYVLHHECSQLICRGRDLFPIDVDLPSHYLPNSFNLNELDPDGKCKSSDDESCNGKLQTTSNIDIQLIDVPSTQ